MKCIIQIPCFNESATLATALAALPRHIEGFDVVEWLIIDDGCADDTVEVAKSCGVDHIVSHPKNLGLARAFMTGLRTCLSLGADVIVNTDADNQYNADDIPKLVTPILENKAEMVIGTRPIANIDHFSPLKKKLQRLGSLVVRYVSGTEIEDAPSGFRAISRSAAARFMVYSKYTYTLETIIQAGQQGIPVSSVPIRVNPDLRPSRLVKSIRSYIWRSIITILRIFILYRPFGFFMSIASVLFVSGFLVGLRFLFFWLIGEGNGHVQSLILASILLLSGGGTCLMALLADLLTANRRLLEELRYTSNLNGAIPIPRLWSRSAAGQDKPATPPSGPNN